MNQILLPPKGFYRDRFKKAQSETYDTGWWPNIIVNRCRFLLAAFKRGEKVKGIQSLHVGKGLQIWDDEDFPSPEPTDQQLVDPVPFQIKILSKSIQYLDEAGKPTKVPTQRIQIAVTLKPGIPPIETGAT